jgi:hypothetical protein
VARSSPSLSAPPWAPGLGAVPARLDSPRGKPSYRTPSISAAGGPTRNRRSGRARGRPVRPRRLPKPGASGFEKRSGFGVIPGKLTPP